MTTTYEDRLKELHDRQLAIRPPRDYGDNDPSDPEQAGWEDSGL